VYVAGNTVVHTTHSIDHHRYAFQPVFMRVRIVSNYLDNRSNGILCWSRTILAGLLNMSYQGWRLAGWLGLEAGGSWRASWRLEAGWIEAPWLGWD